MKRMTAFALAALLAAPVAFAEKAAPQPGGGPGPMMGGEMMMDRMNDCSDLDLNDSQKQQVKAIMEEQRKKHEAIREETHQRISAILTPEQRKKFDEHRADMMEKRSDRMEKRAERMDKRAERMKQRQEKAGSN